MFVSMRHLHAPESNHFNAQFSMEEHVWDVLKIEHDIMDAMPFKSEYLRIVRSIYGFEPKSTCSLVPTIHPLHVLGTHWWHHFLETCRGNRPMSKKEAKVDGCADGPKGAS